MSKKLIAGLGVVAGLAVAMAPVATFAAENNYTSDKHTDHFEITVQPTCAFGHLAVGEGSALIGVEHNTGTAGTIGAAGEYNGTATWTEDATQGVVRNTGRTPDVSTGTAYEETDTAAYSIQAGTTKSGFATTTLTVYCNNSTDAEYTLKVQMEDLTDENSNTIPALATYSASVSGFAMDSVTKSAGNGSVVAAFANKTANKAETVMATSSTGTATTGDIYVVNYGIGVASTQTAGTYEGDVVYTLYQGVAD